ncbi:hypothetical protein [Paenibacillus sp. FSL H8-0079]|uniref:hypothetical protein n=1 Tax=Paenibacillus sp. FSL H8-0079 TaxID=2921375 RepID=UPI0030EE425D
MLGEISENGGTNLWDKLIQLDGETLKSVISLFALFFSLLAIVITFWNVNRQRVANLKNDTEKFKRELNLKTCDEFIEKIFSAKQLLQRTRSLEGQLRWMIFGAKSQEEFNEDLWGIIEDKSIEDLWLYILKREIILKKYKGDCEKLYKEWDRSTQEIWKFKNFWIPGRTDQELFEEIIKPNEVAEPLIELTEKLQRQIQNDFLGHIYQNKI